MCMCDENCRSNLWNALILMSISLPSLAVSPTSLDVRCVCINFCSPFPAKEGGREEFGNCVCVCLCVFNCCYLGWAYQPWWVWLHHTYPRDTGYVLSWGSYYIIHGEENSVDIMIVSSRLVLWEYLGTQCFPGWSPGSIWVHGGYLG